MPLDLVALVLWQCREQLDDGSLRNGIESSLHIDLCKIKLVPRATELLLEWLQALVYVSNGKDGRPKLVSVG